jgi:transposase
LVQMRTRIMNQLQALAMNEGYRWKKKLFSEQGRAQLEKLTLAPWASRRRQELLELLDRMDPTIEEVTAAVEREARKRPAVQRLMTHPGVGPLTALAFVLIIGTWERFPLGKQIGTYVGMIPSEDSSGGKQRLGHISKQGNSLLRFLLVEAAHSGRGSHCYAIKARGCPRLGVTISCGPSFVPAQAHFFSNTASQFTMSVSSAVDCSNV